MEARFKHDSSLYSMKLRPATFDDLARLRHWDAQPHIIAADPDTDWESETALLRTPPWREQFIFEVKSKLIGCIQIIAPSLEETHYWGEVDAKLRAVVAGGLHRQGLRSGNDAPGPATLFCRAGGERGADRSVDQQQPCVLVL